MTIIKKFDTGEINQKFPKKYIFLIAASLLILVVVQIWTNNTAVTFGEKFEQLSKLQQTLKMENQMLVNEIARESSLEVVASKSAELGFSKAESIQYIR